MTSRRIFLRNIFTTLGLLTTSALVTLADELASFKGKEVFDRILAKAVAEKWRALPIGELMGRIARELEGTPYLAGTLELSPDREICAVNLMSLDCVTFFETTLAFARMLKKGGHAPADLLREVSFTRYRQGAPGDYTTRLHYTTDWFVDNEQKGVVKLLCDLPGAETFQQKVGFMSNHPESYHQLVAHPELVKKIRSQENTINHRSLKFIPMNKLAAVEPLLKTGDIVGVCTSQPGIDIGHTGLILRDDQGVAHFMDASSNKRKMKVTIEPGPISRALNWSDKLTGVMFARPLEPQLTSCLYRPFA